MTIENLILLYEAKKNEYAENAYKHISNLLTEAKQTHKLFFEKGKTYQKAIQGGKIPDHEQSWRAFKGKNLEKLIEYIIVDEVKKLGLKIINGNTLERKKTTNLPTELAQIKRNLAIDYGEYGFHLPDVDLIIYEPKTSKVIAVLSSKVTLRERVAQTGYWKLKFVADSTTRHIKVYFITPDEDGTLTLKNAKKKGRAIVEYDTDGCYVLSEAEVEESEKVKMFDKFIPDLKLLLKNT